MQSSYITKLQESKVENFVEFSENGLEIQLVENSDYMETVRDPGSPYSSYKTYYKSNLQLKSEVVEFYNNPIGIQKFYDESGNILSQLNINSEYLFTPTNLIDKLQSDYNINLNLVVKRQFVLMYKDDSNDEPRYRLIIPKGGNSYQKLIISGLTGQIITSQIEHFEE
ncbi:hypothetical protein [Mucilaginibacter psychrotolerans]|uniref:Uncharacterized protein n=1 Tax=Mucilaginibacter psychrotolerans TaxID=1524096 RepID=A0A4Y8S4W4_9SPHI|nr:hypothetical protein [Mucilaginibacter psychrotolerans]TFF33978.1 hypothetical protein E2R66_23650 [Mucilaginibacter psychrotolerans]